MEALLRDASFWTAVAFAVFVVLVAWRGRGALRAALMARPDRIREQLESAASLRDEAQNALAAAQRREREAEAEAAEIVTRAEAEAERLRARARRDLKDAMTRRESLAEARIAQAEAQAARDVADSAAALALAAARDVAAEVLAGPQGDALLDTAVGDLRVRLG